MLRAPGEVATKNFLKKNMGVGLGTLLDEGNAVKRSSGSSRSEATARAVQYVLSQPDLQCLEEDGRIDWESVNAHVLGKVEELSDGEANAHEGFLGPQDVAPDRATTSGQFAYYGNGESVVCALCCVLMQLDGMTHAPTPVS